MRRLSGSTIGLVAVAALLLGFRCPGPDPVTLSDSPPADGGGGTGTGGDGGSAGEGGALPECAVSDLPSVIVEPHDALLAPETAKMLFAVSPDAIAHEVVVVDSDEGTVLDEQAVSSDSGTVGFQFPLPLTPGRYQARLIEQRADCVAVVETRVFATCESMWVDNPQALSPRSVIDYPAVVAGDRVVVPALGNGGSIGLLYALISADGVLDPWTAADVTNAPIVPGGVAAVAVPAGLDDTRIYYLGGFANQQPITQVGSIAVSSIVAPPVDVNEESPLPAPVAGGAAVKLDDTILYVGGSAQSGGGASNAVYGAEVASDGSLATDWDKIGETPHACAGCAAVAFEGSLYTAGGFGEQLQTTVSRGFFDANGELQWDEAGVNAPLPSPLHSVGLTVDPVHGRLFVVGGTMAGGIPTADVLEGRLDANGRVTEWHPIEPLTHPTKDHSVVWTQGRLHVIGGQTETVNQEEIVNNVSSMSFQGPEGTPVCPGLL